MTDNISRPPLSGGTEFKFQVSKSQIYDQAEVEWYWKLSPILPRLWVRDGSKITPELVANLESSWLKYQTLNILGKGDGASSRARTVKGRRMIEEAYKCLDDDVRRAKEVALAQYPDFVIWCTNGTLDYHTEKPIGIGAVAKLAGLVRRMVKK